jgi:hypothetical protein
MVLIAWIGSRLDGRLVVQWGESGTQLEFRAEIKSAHLEHPGARLRHTPAVARRLRALPDDDEIIYGEAHTVEIDISELKALLAAAEADESRAVSSGAAVKGTRPSRPPGR